MNIYPSIDELILLGDHIHTFSGFLSSLLIHRPQHLFGNDSLYRIPLVHGLQKDGRNALYQLYPLLSFHLGKLQDNSGWLLEEIQGFMRNFHKFQHTMIFYVLRVLYILFQFDHSISPLPNLR